MSGKNVANLFFEFGDSDYRTCDFCGKRYNNHGHSIQLMGYHPTKKENYHGGSICADCLTPDPKQLARIAWDRSNYFFTSRPIKGYDPDTWRAWGFDMRAISDALDGTEDFSSIEFGRAALMVVQEYRELDARKRTGKAA
jgi:hypothetical protein